MADGKGSVLFIYLFFKGSVLKEDTNCLIFQARVLEWVAISFSRGSSQPRDGTWVSCTAGRRLTVWATREAQLKVRNINNFWGYSDYISKG